MLVGEAVVLGGLLVGLLLERRCGSVLSSCLRKLLGEPEAEHLHSQRSRSASLWTVSSSAWRTLIFLRSSAFSPALVEPDAALPLSVVSSSCVWMKSSRM